MTTHDTPPSDTTKSARPNPVLVVFLVMPLLFILAALLMIANDLRQQQTIAASTLPEGATGNPAQLVSYQAPDFQLNDLNGNPVSLADYRGKILLLNFWQTTCPPCVRELPEFIAFLEDQPDDVTWLTVNFGETPQMVREFFAEQDLIGVPVVMDPDSATRYEYGVFGAPVTFVLDADGVVRFLNIGELTYAEMETFVEAVRSQAS